MIPRRLQASLLSCVPISNATPRSVQCFLTPLNDSIHNLERTAQCLEIRCFIAQKSYHSLMCILNECRACYLLLLFTPASLTAPFAVGLDLQRQRWLDLVVWTLERAGPAFIKWGQWAATRPDLFPPDLCSKLAQLQTGAPTHPFAYTRQAVESAFGCVCLSLFLVASALLKRVIRHSCCLHEKRYVHAWQMHWVPVQSTDDFCKTPPPPSPPPPLSNMLHDKMCLRATVSAFAGVAASAATSSSLIFVSKNAVMTSLCFPVAAHWKRCLMTLLRSQWHQGV